MEEKLITQFKEVLEIKDREVTVSENFREYPEWDSIASLSIIAMIDEEYSVVFNTSEFNKLKTITELAGEIQKRVGERR